MEVGDLLKSILFAIPSSILLTSATYSLFIYDPMLSWITFSLMYSISVALSGLAPRRISQIIPAAAAGVLVDVLRPFIVLAGVIAGGVTLPLLSLLWEGRGLGLTMEEVRDLMKSMAPFVFGAVFLSVISLTLSFGGKLLLMETGVSRGDISSTVLVNMLYLFLLNICFNKMEDAAGIW